MEAQLFTDQVGRPLRWKQFLASSLGQLYQAIPFSELCALFPSGSNRGRPARLELRGGIALQILKAYLGLSDEKLVDRLNTDWALQYFCGIQLGPGEHIGDKDLVGRWRRYLAKYIGYAAFQAKLVQHWRPFMEQTQAVLMDATCYESHLRYPTDVKLLWESSVWVWDLLDQHCKAAGIGKVRRKQKALRAAFLSYQKRRRKTHKLERKLRGRLLYFLAKGLRAWDQYVFERGVLLTQRHFAGLQTIRTIWEQQQCHFDDPTAKIKDRIVSLAKPYIRPIVRGKETKRTEFGAKVHAFQVDGITLVEYLSFSAFNESTRLSKTVELHESYFYAARQLGADQIYATNANRRFCTHQKITTSFVPKGPKPKDPSPHAQMRQILSNARATEMEGTFGNEKQHYGLDRIRAKTEKTEVLWIYMGIWTASAVKIGRRMAAARKPQAIAA